MSKMRRNSDNEPAFYVVQFIELPFEEIDDYVCVPCAWVVLRLAVNDKTVAVAYPKDEDPFDTRDRVKRKERYNDEWRFYFATIKHESNSYNEADIWIATRNDYGPLVEEKSKLTDTQPKFSKLRSANKNHSSESNDNFRKPLPKSESKKEVDEEPLKLDESAQSSSAVDNDAKVEPRSPKRKQPVIIQDNQSMENSHAEESSVVSHAEESTEPRSKTLRTDQTEHASSSPVKDVSSADRPTAAQNFTGRSRQMNLKFILEQQMLYNFATLFTQMRSTLQHTTDMYNTLRSSIHDTAEIYSKAKDAVKEFNTAGNAANNARSREMNLKFILEQQMLYNFDTLFTQMYSTVEHTTDMYNTLRLFIHDTAKMYKKVLGAVEEFNTAGNAFPSSNPILDVEHLVLAEERRTTLSASASFSNQDQHSNDVANKTPEKNHMKLFRFVLPPEYDAYDSRWTLKYPTYLPGLVELVPESHVYVNYDELKYCQQVSKDCPSLARRLLTEVFTRNALSVCSSMSETAKASNSVGSNIRPDLDDHACSVLLNFVIEHGLQRGWNTSLKPIMDMLHSKTQEIRFHFGIMVEC
ncbi:unnamed protein product [Colias eurytheme]|nr:unnamed protein product [Colias eurytheme]